MITRKLPKWILKCLQFFHSMNENIKLDLSQVIFCTKGVMRKELNGIFQFTAHSHETCCRVFFLCVIKIAEIYSFEAGNMWHHVLVKTFELERS